MTHSKMVARPAGAAIARVGSVLAGIRWVRWPAGAATPAARPGTSAEEIPVRSRQYGADMLAGGGRRKPGPVLRRGGRLREGRCDAGGPARQAAGLPAGAGRVPAGRPAGHAGPAGPG